jgi:hypothetical protein
MNATLVVAVLGVVLSTASLAWQFADYLLSGPRILVHLLHGVADDQLSSVRSWSLDSVPDRDVMDARLADPTRELAVVVVRNIGRSSVYLVSVGLAAGRTGRLRYDTTTAGFDTDRVRLEPGDRYISQADLWPLIDELRSTRPEPTLAVTAVVELGNGRRRHSNRRQAWKVPPNLRSIRPGAPPSYEPANRSGASGQPRFTAAVRGRRRR